MRFLTRPSRGYSGYRAYITHVEMVERADTQSLPDLSNIMAGDTPQLLASIGLNAIPSREHIYREIEQRLLLPEDRLPDHWLSRYQLWVQPYYHHSCRSEDCSRYWDEQISIPSLLSLRPSPPPTSITFIRSGLSGRVTGYAEATMFHLSCTRSHVFLHRVVRL